MELGRPGVLWNMTAIYPSHKQKATKWVPGRSVSAPSLCHGNVEGEIFHNPKTHILPKPSEQSFCWVHEQGNSAAACASTREKAYAACADCAGTLFQPTRLRALLQTLLKWLPATHLMPSKTTSRVRDQRTSL